MIITKIPREKIIYYWIGSISAAVLLLYAFLFGPLVDRLRKTAGECRAAESLAMEKRMSLGALKISEAKKILITEKEVPLAIAELTEKGKSSGIKFISIRTMPIIESGGPQYRILPVEMEIEAAYYGLIEFTGSFGFLKESLVTLGDFSIMTDKNSELLKVNLIINMYISQTQI